MDEIYERHVPPLRRFPTAYWLKLRQELPFLTLIYADRTQV